MPLAKRAAMRMLGCSVVSRALRALARARGHRLVLVYHRVGAPAPLGCEIVPSVTVDVFRAHLQALGDVVELVTLDAILAEGGRVAGADAGRPAVAVTFDDDLPSHQADALPLLRAAGVPAAFFLSGRALHGKGPYWFQWLEALIAAHGSERAAAVLGVPEARPADLALACERDSAVQQRLAEASVDVPRPAILDAEGIAALSAAGMTIGFHTLDHSVLPSLDDAALEDAVTRGSDRLAAVAGAAVRYFAYPHGKVDARSAAAVRRAEFTAAFTGIPGPLRPQTNRHRVGRWEPGALGVDDLLVMLALQFHRASPAAGQDGL